MNVYLIGNTKDMKGFMEACAKLQSWGHEVISPDFGVAATGVMPEFNGKDCPDERRKLIEGSDVVVYLDGLTTDNE